MLYFQIYPSKMTCMKAVEWSWRLREMATHDILATGSNSFTGLWDCIHHVQVINQRLPSSFITVTY